MTGAASGPRESRGASLVHAGAEKRANRARPIGRSIEPAEARHDCLARDSVDDRDRPAANRLLERWRASRRGAKTPRLHYILKGISKNRRFPPPRKSDSRCSCSERERLAWDILASSI